MEPRRAHLCDLCKRAEAVISKAEGRVADSLISPWIDGSEIRRHIYLRVRTKSERVFPAVEIIRFRSLEGKSVWELREERDGAAARVTFYRSTEGIRRKLKLVLGRYWHPKPIIERGHHFWPESWGYAVLWWAPQKSPLSVAFQAAEKTFALRGERLFLNKPSAKKEAV